MGCGNRELEGGLERSLSHEGQGAVGGELVGALEGELEIGPGKGNWRENWRGIAGAGDVGGASGGT